MKKIILLFGLLLLNGFLFSQNLNLESFMEIYTNNFSHYIQNSYKYIDVKYKNITPENKIYPYIQKAIYIDIFPNYEINLPINGLLKQEFVAFIIKNKLGFKINYEIGKYVTKDWLEKEINKINKQIQGRNPNENIKLTTQEKIMQNVYWTLINRHIEAKNIDQKELEYGAIKGMVNSINDRYTVFMDPEDAKDLQENLEGKFYGIGAYVEMTRPGVFTIVSPMIGSPAHEAGLLPLDIITHINGKEITTDMSEAEVVKKIKGPKGTEINLTILRNRKTFDVKITRGEITVPNIKISKNSKLTQGTCFLSLSNFSSDIENNFKKIMKKLEKKECNKYIFDLRNNPGGRLDAVSEILDTFVPTGEPVVTTKSKQKKQVYLAGKTNREKLINKNIIFLINKGTASAAEIMVATAKEYGKNVVIIGEQSFGKGTVQEVIPYIDGSMLKITTAKRYTGKEKNNINGTGVSPDITISDNPNTELDEQLEKAINYKF